MPSDLRFRRTVSPDTRGHKGTRVASSSGMIWHVTGTEGATGRRRSAASGGNTKGRRASFGSVRALPSGRVQARYTGPDGTTHKAPITFDTKGDARAWLALRQSEILRDEWAPLTRRGSAVLFGDYATAWVAGRDLKPRTRELYSAVLTSRLLPTFGAVRGEGDHPRRGAPLALRAGQHRPDRQGARLRAAAVHPRDRGRGRTDPGEPVPPPRRWRSKRVKKVRPPALPELEALVAAMPDRYQVMTLLAAWCGLRFGELTELRRSDVDLRHGVLQGPSRRRAGRWRLPSRLAEVGGRGARRGDPAAPAARGPSPPAAQHRGRPGWAAVPGCRTEGTLRPRRCTACSTRLGKGRGRPDLRWHDLRHTGAVLAASTGATLAELMSRLGHSTPAAALRYQHAAQGRDAEIAKALSALVEP